MASLARRCFIETYEQIEMFFFAKRLTLLSTCATLRYTVIRLILGTSLDLRKCCHFCSIKIKLQLPPVMPIFNYLTVILHAVEPAAIKFRHLITTGNTVQPESPALTFNLLSVVSYYRYNSKALNLYYENTERKLKSGVGRTIGPTSAARQPCSSWAEKIAPTDLAKMPNSHISDRVISIRSLNCTHFCCRLISTKLSTFHASIRGEINVFKNVNLFQI